MADATPFNFNRLIEAAIVGAVLTFGLWLWHDTRVRDAAALQAVTTAKTSQAVVDKTAGASDTSATQQLQKQNALLAQQLTAAKTTAQKLTLINKQMGTTIALVPAEATHQATNPSHATLPDAPVATLSTNDVTELAQDSTECSQAKLTAITDAIVLHNDNAEIEARNQTITAQEAEITSLKGGSHIKRFFKAVEHVGIGIGIGVVVDRALRK